MDTSTLVLPSLDTPTLAVARAVIQMTLAGLIIWTGSRQVQRSGAVWWAAGLALHGLALLVFSVRYAPLDALMTAANHLGFGVSSACLLIGFWRFARKPIRWWLPALVVGISVISLILWDWWLPNARFRILTTASSQVIFLIGLLALLLHPPRREMAGIYRALAWIVGVYAILVFWAYASVGELLPTTARVVPGYHGILFSVGSMLFMLALAVGCLALQYAELACRHADQARRDWLTGLLNRRGLLEAMSSREACFGTHSTYTVLVIDADYFKSVNDQYGHAIGDRLLEALADVLAHRAGPADLVARMGGEEFVFLHPDSGSDAASYLADELRSALGGVSIGTGSGPVRVSVSIGGAVHRPGETYEQVMQRADQALYRAKQAGRDRAFTAESSSDG
jgi:diguanylate cyclase (GGDEF)-like protein